jgi:phosphate transport system protein
MDEAINAANRQIVHDLLALGATDEERESRQRQSLVSRAHERIGDHAVDSGEQVAYLVTGEFREFTDASGDPVRLDR